MPNKDFARGVAFSGNCLGAIAGMLLVHKMGVYGWVMMGYFSAFCVWLWNE